MNKVEVFLRKHSSTILTVAGTVGVVATTVLAVKATPKALTLLEEAREEKGDELTPGETVKAAWKPYIPATITGVSTIACIFGINVLSTRNQASLMSAYALLDSSYREYREKTIELFGEDADLKIKQEVFKSRFDDVDPELEEDEEYFFDYHTMHSFVSTFEKVREAERVFNEYFIMSGFACVNDFYEILGLDPIKNGYQLGWPAVSGNEELGLRELEFKYERVKTDDGIEGWIITMPQPIVDYIY